MASNFDIGFRVEGKKALLLRGKNKTELPRNVAIEVYRLVVGCLSSNRDYSNVTSSQKLLKIIDLECEPDESDDETSTKKVVPAKKNNALAKGGKKTPVKTPIKKGPAVRKPPVKQESEDEDDEDDDEDDDDEDDDDDDDDEDDEDDDEDDDDDDDDEDDDED